MKSIKSSSNIVVRRSRRVAALHCRLYDKPVKQQKVRVQYQQEHHVCTNSRKKTKKYSRKVSNRKQTQLKINNLKDEKIEVKNHNSHIHLLLSALTQDDYLDDTSWLTSPFMDVVLWKIAKQYPKIHFLPTDFMHLYLTSRKSFEQRTNGQLRDILGQFVDFQLRKSIVFIGNIGRIHWNLFRVQFVPTPELQVFEPMGRLSTRTGITFRAVPRDIVTWLDDQFPIQSSWKNNVVSAITIPQQVSGFDCGVACLLYAIKCGQEQNRDTINEGTNQLDITKFRKELQLFVLNLHTSKDTQRIEFRLLE